MTISTFYAHYLAVNHNHYHYLHTTDAHVDIPMGHVISTFNFIVRIDFYISRPPYSVLSLCVVWQKGLGVPVAYIGGYTLALFWFSLLWKISYSPKRIRLRQTRKARWYRPWILKFSQIKVSISCWHLWHMSYESILFLHYKLTNCGRVTDMFFSKHFGPNNALLPGRRQAIIWTNAGIVNLTARIKLQ